LAGGTELVTVLVAEASFLVLVARTAKSLAFLELPRFPEASFLVLVAWTAEPLAFLELPRFPEASFLVLVAWTAGLFVPISNSNEAQ
jgi:hypothetical protein